MEECSHGSRGTASAATPGFATSALPPPLCHRTYAAVVLPPDCICGSRLSPAEEICSHDGRGAAPAATPGFSTSALPCPCRCVQMWCFRWWALRVTGQKVVWRAGSWWRRGRRWRTTCRCRARASPRTTSSCARAAGELGLAETGHVTPCSPLIGRSCALDIAISTMADAGQNILVPRPGFPIYTTLSAGQVC